MKYIKHALLLAILLPFQTVSANAYNRADIIFASPVKQYEDGYLVSIKPLEGSINQGGYLNKYLKRVLKGPGSYTPYY
ncbi:MAG TPA: hypothetical protein VMF29_02875, partial [Candidatus Edwardsbacteria bacterium]|nr:hypothetical protein [Candidatus Edwardsbacteria bacterium]